MLHDYAEPRFDFQRSFELAPWSTQYLAVYAGAWLLTGTVGVVMALKLVLAVALSALPYAMRALLRALGKPESYALLVLPLLYNSQLLLGFLNFIAGLPLLLWGMKLAILQRLTAERRVAIQLGAVTLACFVTHVVPFALLVLAATLLAWERDWRATLRRLLPLLPAALAFALWSQLAPAGQALSALVTGSGPTSAVLPLEVRLAELPLWLNDVLPGAEDEIALWGFIAATAALLLFARSAPVPTPSWSRRLVLLPLGAVLGYLLLPPSAGFIWPIHARFALLALLLLIPTLPVAPPALRRVTAAVVLAVSFIDVLGVFRAFRRIDAEETAGLPALIARVPYGSNVAGLIFDASSRHLKFSPFLHAVAWSQVERGGAVMFTFADFPVSPIRFRAEHRPPPVPPRWEWLPHRVDTRRDLTFYDYVLTRRAPRPLPGWHRESAQADWALWARGE